MKSVLRKALPAVLAGSALASGASVFAAEPATTQDIQQQLQSLQAKVAQLEVQQKQSDQATINSVLADAEKRSQLLADTPDVTSGYDKGFFIQSADKSFTLRPGILLQVRNNTTWREEGKNGDSNDVQNGWEIRRVKLNFSGNLYGPDLTYVLQLQNNRNASGIELDDAILQYKLTEHNFLKVGQFKAPFNREETISDAGQLAVERSLLNDLLGGGVSGPRIQGGGVLGGLGGENYAKDPVHYELIFSDGDASANTDFRDQITGAGVTDTRPDYGVTGRVEYKAFGQWTDYGKVSAKTNKEDLFIVGAAVNVNGVANANNYRFAIDGLYQGFDGKLNVLGAAIGSYSEFRNTVAGAEDDRFDYGGLVQAGYLVAPQWEPFARADITFFDEDLTAGDNQFPEFAVGVNYYLGKDGSAFNRAKFVVDLNYLPSSVPNDRTSVGYLANGGRNEFVLRAQFQFGI